MTNSNHRHHSHTDVYRNASLRGRHRGDYDVYDTTPDGYVNHTTYHNHAVQPIRYIHPAWLLLIVTVVAFAIARFIGGA